jgi:pimeloyl-ACP methyl ester carboxylesterase
MIGIDTNLPGRVTSYPAAGDYVIALHGLGHTRSSFRWMSRRLQDAGYHVLNVGYPSRRKPLASAAREHVAPVVDALLRSAPRRRIHFVAHSLGCIVTREFLGGRSSHADGAGRLGRVVMLAPPNQGSEILDTFGSRWWARAILGPVTKELLTDESSPVRRLGPARLETGILMGNRPLIPFFRNLLDGQSDGIVRVEGGHLDGAADFVVLPVDHTVFVRRKLVFNQVVAFLKHGRFFRNE